MAARTVLPELARDSHLVTRMTSDYCVHFFAETPTVTRKEVWKRTKRIGAGGFGTVWLEKCIEGQESGNDKYRAVKVLRLPSSAQAQDAIAQCGRELEALAKFSQRKVHDSIFLYIMEAANWRCASIRGALLSPMGGMNTHHPSQYAWNTSH